MPGYIPRQLLDQFPVDNSEPTYRMSMLPFGTYADPNGGGEHLGFAMPGMIQEPINALMRLGQNTRFDDGRLGIPNPQNLDNQHDTATLIESLLGGNATRGVGAGEAAAARAYETTGTRRAPLPEMAVDQPAMSDRVPILRRSEMGEFVDPAVPPFTLTRDPALPPNVQGEHRWPSDWAERDFRLANETQARGFSDLYSDTGKPSPVGAAVAGAERPGFDVWHGSPHDFDKFDLSKIGTGEGAQAYGHGLYFAEAPDVAKEYQLALSKNDPGYLYQARVNADPEHFLDWDKPLSQQPKLKAKLENIPAYQAARSAYDDDLLDTDWYGWDVMDRGAPSEMSKALLKAGIPGVKYLDAGSRGVADGSRNYVLFDDSLVDTLHKWRGDQQLYSDTGNLSPFGAAVADPYQDQDPRWNSLFNY